MHAVIGICPICHNNLSVTRLHCRSCDSTLEGQFALGRLYQLSAEQLQFVELFVRCEGKIKRVEDELGLSYPAVRARLEDTIRALGYEVGDTPTKSPLSDRERQELLARVARGEISAEDAVDLLQR